MATAAPAAAAVSCRAPVAGFSSWQQMSTARPARAPVAFRRGRLQICCAVAEPATLETVQKVIASQLSVNEADVKPDSKFADLGADSLDTVEIMMNLEESFKISLGEEGAEKIVTVQDAADMIQGMLSKSS